MRSVVGKRKVFARRKAEMAPFAAAAMAVLASVAVGVHIAQPSKLPASVGALEAAYPGFEVELGECGVGPDLCEVTIGDRLAFVDPSGRFLLGGRVVDLSTGEDVGQTLEIRRRSQHSKSISESFKHGNSTAVMSWAGLVVQASGADRRASSAISKMVEAPADAAPASNKAPVAQEGEDDV